MKTNHTFNSYLFFSAIIKPVLLFIIINCSVLVSVSFPQTCAGYISIELTDNSRNPIGSSSTLKLETFQNAFVREYYEENQSVMQLSEILTNRNYYKISDENGKAMPKIISVTDSKTDIEISTLCGYYLIQIYIDYDGKKMNIGFYNVPPHVCFSINPLKFQEGNFFVNIGVDYTRNRDFKKTGAGIYSIPPDYMGTFDIFR